MPKPRIVIVDDEEPQSRSFANHFCDEFDVVQINEPNTLIEAIDRSVCVAIVDERMGSVSGIKILSALRAKSPNVIRILITGYGDEYLASAVNQARIFHYVEKPYDAAELRKIIREAVQEFRIREKGLEQLRRFQEERDVLSAHPAGRAAIRETLGFSAIIGKSREITGLVERARRAVNNSIPVLINGETGTGKTIRQGLPYQNPRK